MSMGRSAESIAHTNLLRRESYHWYKAHGICNYCKQAYAEPGRVYCARCYRQMRVRQEINDPGRKKRSAYNIERRARLKAAGLCVDCGRVDAMPGFVRCPKCRKKNAEQSMKYNLKKKIEREARER